MLRELDESVARGATLPRTGGPNVDDPVASGEAGRGAADLRRLCEIALLPPVRIARREPDFVRFLQVIGELVFLPSESLSQARHRHAIDTVREVGRRIREQLDVPRVVLEQRLELIDRMAVLLLAQRARSGESFSGPAADLYFATVLDAMVEILSGPVSPETQRSLHQVAAESPAKREQEPGASSTKRSDNRSSATKNRSPR